MQGIEKMKSKLEKLIMNNPELNASYQLEKIN